MTSGEFDPEILRRIDRPRRPAPVADERIRSSMLAAFDAVLADDTEADDDPPAADLGPTQVLELVPTDEPGREDADGAEGVPTTGAGRAPDRWRRWTVVAAAAAVVLVVAAIAVLRPGAAPSDPLDPADQRDADALVVNRVCVAEIAPLVDDVAAFLARPGGERTDRALRNVELIAQRYADLASEVSDPLASTIEATGGRLLTDAAAARRAWDDGDDTGVRTVAGDLGRELDALPGSTSCRATDLGGTTP